jgi:UDP-glucose 4-epimerase
MKVEPMKLITVFGGSGFLGSYVVSELCDRGYKVVIADISKPDFNLDNASFVECDILDPSSIERALKGSDIVFNFAGFADVDQSIYQPTQTFQLNVIGNINILEGCAKIGIERYIYASSAYAFSNSGSFYGISKLASEKIIEEFEKRHNIPFTIIRYGSLYGERANEMNGIYRILKQAVDSAQIDFPGDGEGVREYIHASDAAVLSVDIIMNDKYLNEHLILTGMERYRHKDILRMIQEIFDDKIEVNYTDAEYTGHYSVTPYSFQPNTAKKLILNPYIDLGQGMIQCIEHIHNQIKPRDGLN